MVFNVSKGPYPRPRDPKPKFNVEALPLRGLVAVSKFSKLRPFSREGQGAPAVVGGQTNRETVRAVRAWAAEGLPRHSRHDFGRLIFTRLWDRGGSTWGIVSYPGPGFNFEHF